MAAPTKAGLDYFPFDVDLLVDRKLRRPKMKYGYLATLVYISLLSMLYKDKGYYIDYSDNHKDDVVWGVMESMQGKYQPTSETVVEIIEDLVACELFSDDQFKSKTITSIRAQRTYYRSTVDRKAVEIDFDKWLLTEIEMRAISEKSIVLRNFINRPINEVNRPINVVNKPINPQSKVKESKVKESKVKESISYQQIADMYNDTCVSFPKVTSLSKKRKKAIKARSNTYTEDDFKKLFVMAEQSDFLKGKNSRDWQANFDWLIADGNMAKVLDGNYVNKNGTGEIKKPMAKKNGFTNYEQRNYDYDAFEKIEREKL